MTRIRKVGWQLQGKLKTHNKDKDRVVTVGQNDPKLGNGNEP